MKPALMTTTGYVYSKDKKHLKTFASYDDNETFPTEMYFQ